MPLDLETVMLSWGDFLIIFLLNCVSIFFFHTVSLSIAGKALRKYREQLGIQIDVKGDLNAKNNDDR